MNGVPIKSMVPGGKVNPRSFRDVEAISAHTAACPPRAARLAEPVRRAVTVSRPVAAGGRWPRLRSPTPHAG
jgi:hypothetical protein